MNEQLDHSVIIAPNMFARSLLADGNTAESLNDMDTAEDKWINSVRVACTLSCFDPGVIFIASYRLAHYYSSRNRDIECNVSIQQALMACDKAFTDNKYPEKILLMRSLLISLREKNNTRAMPSDIECLSYSRQELMAIRNSLSNLSSSRPNELYKEIQISSLGNGKTRGKKISHQHMHPKNETKRDLSETVRARTSVGTSEHMPSLDEWAGALEIGIANALGDDHTILQCEKEEDYDYS